MRHLNFSKQLHKKSGFASAYFPSTHLVFREYWRLLNWNTWGLSPGQADHLMLRSGDLTPGRGVGGRLKLQQIESLQCCSIRAERAKNCKLCMQLFPLYSLSPVTAACKNVAITGYLLSVPAMLLCAMCLRDMSCPCREWGDIKRQSRNRRMGDNIIGRLRAENIIKIPEGWSQ